MINYNFILGGSLIVGLSLFVILWYKMFLHYTYLYKIGKVSKWTNLVIFPFGDLNEVFLITMPFFIPLKEDVLMDDKILRLIKLFWSIFAFYFVMLFLVFIAFT